jgi:hypothetical protein
VQLHEQAGTVVEGRAVERPELERGLVAVATRRRPPGCRTVQGPVALRLRLTEHGTDLDEETAAVDRDPLTDVEVFDDPTRSPS